MRYFFYFSIFLLITKQSIIDLLFFYSLQPDGPRELERDERNIHESHQNKRKPASLDWQAHFADKRDWKTYLSSNDVPEPTPKQLLRYGYYLNLITRLIGEEGTRRLLSKARLGETPQAQAEEAPRPPLDKRVPGSEINIQIV
ncbi:hypothetical protein FC682_03565 [Peribacillus simplex]|uniref:Uncharacterized protein n=1 Tax=Peribacillus simplex TaxID=1478 RepID=A0A9X9ETU8_9BACI|nr:hypothetical protein [Peribacillus simplex]TKH06794.1 hypothetical protein FC682_03565 [Peribacillus simplex]TKH14275.1 hypothetical protein FC678_05165 [Peribacillus simplex]